MSHQASFFLLNLGRNSVPSWNVRCVCRTNEFTGSPVACMTIAHSGFTNLHSKCTWSTVILPPHLHMSVCCEWREIWCATRHTWLRVWWEGIRLTLIHATLLTPATICVLRCEPWSGLSAACTSSYHILVQLLNKVFGFSWSWTLECSSPVCRQVCQSVHFTRNGFILGINVIALEDGTCLPWVQVKVPSSTTSHCDKVVRALQSWVIQNPKSCPWPILDSNYFIVFVLMHCS